MSAVKSAVTQILKINISIPCSVLIVKLNLQRWHCSEVTGRRKLLLSLFYPPLVCFSSSTFTELITASMFVAVWPLLPSQHTQTWVSIWVASDGVSDPSLDTTDWEDPHRPTPLQEVKTALLRVEATYTVREKCDAASILTWNNSRTEAAASEVYFPSLFLGSEKRSGFLFFFFCSVFFFKRCSIKVCSYQSPIQEVYPLLK